MTGMHWEASDPIKMFCSYDGMRHSDTFVTLTSKGSNGWPVEEASG